jgi:phage shock protein A
VAVQSRFNSAKRLVEAYQEQLTRQDAEFKNLLSAKVKLEARLATMKAEREELTALLELAKSKETTVKVVKSLKDLTGSGDADIARIANSIRTRLDKASTASEMQTASLDSQMDDVLERTELDTQLAERKRKLGLGA